MTTFMPPPPVSTFLSFHPLDNNIIAIGMEDSTIHIYNVRVDEVINLSIFVSVVICHVIEVLLLISNMTRVALLLGQNKTERSPETHYWFSIFCQP